MAWRDDEPDFEMQGILLGPAGKALKFRADFGPDEVLFIPVSQSDWIPDLDSNEEGRGTMMVRMWLAKKNEWDRQ